MRIVFLGTPWIGAVALRTLARRHEVALVVSAAPRPRGRGRKLQESDVAEAARSLGLPILTPERLDGESVAAILATGAQAAAVVAYGRMLPSALHARIPCLNLHPSLLPRHRGAAPIPWTIWSGDQRWGITIMRIVRELDAGPVLAQQCWPLGLETSGELLEMAAQRGAQMLSEVLRQLAEGSLQERPQEGVATYARMLTSEDERIDFGRPAEELARQVRALAPKPGARVQLAERGLEMRLLDAQALPGDAPPGRLVAVLERIGFGTAAGVLAVGRVQPAGGRAQSAADFLRGRPWAVGSTAR